MPRPFCWVRGWSSRLEGGTRAGPLGDRSCSAIAIGERSVLAHPEQHHFDNTNVTPLELVLARESYASEPRTHTHTLNTDIPTECVCVVCPSSEVMHPAVIESTRIAYLVCDGQSALAGALTTSSANS